MAPIPTVTILIARPHPKSRLKTTPVLTLVTLATAWSMQIHAQGKPVLDTIYQDESHCLTAPDIRGEKDQPISCFCRDAIVTARYVYSVYLLPGKDRNLNGAFLSLVQEIPNQCGTKYKNTAFEIAKRENWAWEGPEVVRAYPPDEVIRRISPVSGARWVSYTVQLVFRDSMGRVSRTENYSSREMEPSFEAEHKPK